MVSESDSGGLRKIVRLWAVAQTALSLFAAPAPVAPKITPIRAIHHLSDVRAIAPAEITVEGVVTQCSMLPAGFTVQDASDGMFIQTDNAHPPQLSQGDRVMITGAAAPGEFAPILVAHSIEKKGRSRLPRPRVVTEAEVSGGVLDNLFVEIRGTVRAAAGGERVGGTPAAYLMLDIQDQNADFVDVAIAHPDGDPIRYVDAAVAARGVVSVIYNRKRQAAGLKLVVDDAANIRIVRPPAADPFAIELTPISDILQWNVRRDWSHRVRVAGIVTLQRQREFVILQDGSAAIRVENESRAPLAPGSYVEAIGFVSASGYSPTLKNGVIRARTRSDVVVPIRRRPRQLLAGDDDDLLVTTSATVLDTGRASGRFVLSLEDEGVQFEAEAPGRAGKLLGDLSPGARVELTGVCHIIPDTLRNPRSFQILLRSADDVHVLSASPRLTLQRVMWTTCLLGSAALLCGLWALVMRRRVQAQTRWIQSSLEREHRAARIMAQRSAILERVGLNDPLDMILEDIVHLAQGHIPGALAVIAVHINGDSWSVGANPDSGEPCTAISVGSTSGKIQATLTVSRKPRCEWESEALRVCRECLVLAIEHRDLHDRLLEQSLSDPLTRLPNRRSLDERFQQVLEQARRENERVAVLALDLDSFKEVNDTLGHAAGDAVLQELSRRFTAMMRRTDLIARVGGDEFVAVLPRVGDQDRAMEVAERLVAAASSAIEVNGIRLVTSVSVGAAFFPEDGDTPEILRHTADLRMYERKMRSEKRRVKQAGPASVVF